MKLSVEIDLNDFYPENFDSGECSIAAEIKDLVRCQVRTEISKHISDDIKELISDSYNEFAKDKMKLIVDHQMESFVNEGMVSESVRSKELIPIKDELREVFDQSGWNSPYDKMEKMSKKFGEEMRKRYDLAFASNIVKSLNQQNLLVDGVEKLLSDK